MTVTDTANDLLDRQRPEPLISNGKYVIGGKHFTRATTFAKSIDDHFGLDRWQMRMVAIGLGFRRDLYAQAASLTTADDDRSKLDEVCELAKEAAASSAGANLGTALHTFTERVDRGEQFEIPAPWDADVAAYTTVLATSGIRIDRDLMEKVVVQRRLQVAGRFDRIVTIDGFPLPLIADLKTGNVDRSWSAIGVQLAVYANADDIYDPDTDTCTPMPAVDLEQALVIHLPAGQAECHLYLVDIAAGWKAAQLCAEVRSWRGNRRIATKFETTFQERTRWLADRLTVLRDQHPEVLESLAAIWPAGVPTFKQGGPQDDAQITQVALAVSTVEAQHQIPFGASDPVAGRPDDATITRLLNRVKALPGDLAGELSEQGVSAGIPHVQGRRFAIRHIDELEPLLAGVEGRARRRLGDANDHVLAIASTDAEVEATYTACGSDGMSWTEVQLAMVRAIRAYVTVHGCTFVATPVGTTLTFPDGEKQLVAQFGSKRDALAAVKQIAEAAGLAKPRSIADVVEQPGLLALAVEAIPSSDITDTGVPQ